MRLSKHKLTETRDYSYIAILETITDYVLAIQLLASYVARGETVMIRCH